MPSPSIASTEKNHHDALGVWLALGAAFGFSLKAIFVKLAYAVPVAGGVDAVTLLALRMVYEENIERLGLEQDALCTVRDILEKVVTDYAILPAKPNMDEVKRALTLFENHRLIQRIDGRFNKATCRFAILPTILSVISEEKLDAVVSVLKKGEGAADEETETDSVD